VLWLEVKAPFSQEGHIWAEIVLVLSFGALVLAWLKANELAMLREDREKRKSMQTSPGWLGTIISLILNFLHRLL
jgi:hypothetical protein